MQSIQVALWLTALLAITQGPLLTNGQPLKVEPDRSCTCPRRDIRELDSQPGPQRDLFYLAFADLQSRPSDDPTSFFQMARIHGSPGTDWDGLPRGYGTYACVNGCDSGGDPTGLDDGYCSHGSRLFPTWHRPYLLFFEQELVKSAKRIAAQYPDNLRADYVAAASQLRLPFWAWDDPITDTQGPPEALTAATCTVVRPDGQQATIANPLLRYRYQQSVPGGAAAGSFTQRVSDWPARVRSRAASWRQQVSAAFATSSYEGFASQVGSSTSIESVHGAVHVAVGGHMGLLTIAGFDPVFWLHHCNVDKLIAQWQARWPGSWVSRSGYEEPVLNYGVATVEGATYRLAGDTSLFPFRFDDSNFPDFGFWWSDDARDITGLGYTVPGAGTPSGCCAASVGRRLQTTAPKMPPRDTSSEGYRVILAFEGVDTSQCGGKPVSLNVSVGDKKKQEGGGGLIKPILTAILGGGKSEKPAKPCYAGALDIFASGKSRPVSGTVDITQALLDEGIVKKDNKCAPPKDLVDRYVQYSAQSAQGPGNQSVKNVKVGNLTAHYGRFDASGCFVEGKYAAKPLIAPATGEYVQSNARVQKKSKTVEKKQVIG